MGDFLIERARAAVEKIDLERGPTVPAAGVQRANRLRLGAAQVRHRVGARRSRAAWSLPAFKALVLEKAHAAYEEKEMAYPVMAGLLHFTTRDATGHKRYDREELADWAAQRFGVELSIEDLKNKQRDEIRALLVEHSRRFAEGQEAAMVEAHAWLGRIFSPDTPADKALRAAFEDGRLQELSAWLAEKYNYDLPPEEMLRCSAERLERHLTAAVEDLYRPEMRKMERALVLQLLDTAWKDHLLGDGPLAQQRGTPRLRPDRSQGGIQARRDADFRADVDFRGRAGDRSDIPHGAARRGFCRLDVEGVGGDPSGRPVGRRDRRPAAGGHRRHGGGPQAAADPQSSAARGPERSLPVREREEV